ncbi:MAG: DUF72 domain-containing protein [Promethearchaeota archaeon]
MASFHIGTSGWGYDEWVGPVYPHGIKNAKMLDFYVNLFNTCEINTSFYHIPRDIHVRAWNKKVPDEFTFSVKLYRGITHDAKLDPRMYGNLLDMQMARFEPLEAKIKAYLLQLPPSFSMKNEGHHEYLIKFLENWGHHWPPEKLVVEFRNLTWMNDDAFDLLKEYRVVYCIVVEPLLPPRLDVTNRDLAYIRFHGFGKDIWFDYNFSPEQVKSWSTRIKELSKKVKNVNIYFNNHFSGHAVKNAIDLMDLLGEPHASLARLQAKHSPNKGQKSIDSYF